MDGAPVTNVTLTFPELLQAAIAGTMRQVQNLRDVAEEKHGAKPDKDWQVHCEGAAGEMALAKHRDVYWTGRHGFRQEADVRWWQVRTTPYATGCLLLHPEDRDDNPFVLVTGLNGRYTLRGWLLAADGKLDMYWGDKPPDSPPEKTGTGRPCYWVPQSVLHRMETLE